MYCSTCGSAVAHGLSYCKHCGSKLGRAAGDRLDEPTGPKPELFVRAMTTVFIFGLGAIIGLMAVMRRLPDFDFGRIMAVTLLSFLMMLLIEGVFAWLLLRSMRGAKEAGEAAPSNEPTTNELDAAQARALPEPLPSVTENTTRTLDPVYSERKSK